MAVTRLGRYEVLEVIGRGTMGVVYRGHDPVIDRPVALKAVAVPEALPPAKREAFLERFAQEARIAGRLLHPNIVVTYDAATDEASGTPFIAMELVQGEALDRLMERLGRLPWREALTIVIPLARALGAAHELNVIHRDVKPANVLITHRGVPKLTDFGIARLPTSSLTGRGALLGTPDYMSPEQVRGGRVDGRSDLFCLAEVLYGLLVGHPPFRGAELAEIFHTLLTTDPAPPSATVPDVPAELDAVLAKALAKAPEDRYPSGERFAEALEAVARDLADRPEALAADDADDAPGMVVLDHALDEAPSPPDLLRSREPRGPLPSVDGAPPGAPAPVAARHEARGQAAPPGAVPRRPRRGPGDGSGPATVEASLEAPVDGTAAPAAGLPSDPGPTVRPRGRASRSPKTPPESERHETVWEAAGEGRRRTSIPAGTTGAAAGPVPGPAAPGRDPRPPARPRAAARPRARHTLRPLLTLLLLVLVVASLYVLTAGDAGSTREAVREGVVRAAGWVDERISALGRAVGWQRLSARERRQLRSEAGQRLLDGEELRLRGRWDEALAALERSLAAFGEVGDGAGQAAALRARARLEADLGQPAQALADADAALAIDRLHEKPRGETEALVLIASLRLDLGDEAGAAAASAAALAAADRLGDPGLRERLHLEQGLAALRARRFSDAREQLEAVRDRTAATDDWELAARAAGWLAVVDCVEGDGPRALARWRSARATCERGGAADCAAELRLLEGAATLAAGDLAEAGQVLGEAETWLRGAERLPGLAAVLELEAEIADRQGDRAQAQGRRAELATVRDQLGLGPAPAGAGPLGSATADPERSAGGDGKEGAAPDRAAAPPLDSSCRRLLEVLRGAPRTPRNEARLVALAATCRP